MTMMFEETDESGLPTHLYIPVDERFKGPVPSKSAYAWVCWCAAGKECEILPRSKTVPSAATSVTLENSTETLTNVHPSTACEGRLCPIHNRSDHPMRSFPQHWRSDTGVMERICPHGVGHPDPDGWIYLSHALGEREAAAKFMHGCDGCGHGPDDDALFDILREDDDD